MLSCLTLELCSDGFGERSNSQCGNLGRRHLRGQSRRGRVIVDQTEQSYES